MYLIKNANTNEIMMSNVNAIYFNDKVDAEIFVNEQAENNFKEFQEEYKDETVTLEDFKSNYEIAEVKFEVGYGDTEICYTRQEVMLGIKSAYNKALMDPTEDYSAIEACEHIKFIVSGDCSEINGNYDLWGIGDNGEINHSNLPDYIRNIF